jgi:hypothetical protein
LSREPRNLWKQVPKYKMVAEEFAKSQATNLDLTLRERLWWLAMWQAKPNGHATFQNGEISRLLPVRYRGQIAPATDRAIRKARAEAKAAGQLHVMSDANCLVLPADAVQNRRSGWEKPCSHCMGYTPEPSTVITLRDYESESLDRESYRREMNSQARAILQEPIVPVGGTNRSALDIPTHGPDCALIGVNRPQHQEIA